MGQELTVALHRRGDRHAPLVAQADALADAQEAGDEWRAVLAECWGALLASRMGAHREADALLSSAWRRAARSGDRHLGLVSAMVGLRDLEEGRPAAAERALALALELLGDVTPSVSVEATRIMYARALARCRSVEEAAAELALPFGRLTVQPHDVLATGLDAFAEVASLAGRRGGTSTAIVAATRIRRQVGFPRRPHEIAAVEASWEAPAERRAGRCSIADACAAAGATLAAIGG